MWPSSWLQGKLVTEALRVVSIGEIVVSREPTDILVAFGLGSCVVVCLYDPLKRIGGMLHALLPTAPNEGKARSNPTRFVQQGVPILLDDLLKQGAIRFRMRAVLCGGARMMSSPVFDGRFNVGEKNVRVAESVLQSLNIPIWARATGGNQGRTIKFCLANGQVTVRTMRDGEQVLTP
jgi:chemotaxis protein CheD